MGRTTEARTPTRSNRVCAPALVLSLCALLLAAFPAVAADADHVRPTREATAGGPPQGPHVPPGHQRSEEPQPGSSEDPEHEQEPSVEPRTGSGAQPQGGKGEAAASVPATGREPAQNAQPRSVRHQRAAESHERQKAKTLTSPSTTTSSKTRAAGGRPATTQSTTPGAAGATTRASTRRSTSGRSSLSRATGKGATGTASPATATPAPGAATSAAASPAATSSPAAVQLATPATQLAPTTPSTQVTSTQVRTSPAAGPRARPRRRSTGATRHRSRRGAARKRSARSRAALEGLPAAVATSAPLASARPRTRRDGDPSSVSRRASAHSRPSQIVTTITHIVGVVPTSVWVLVGLLGALALALALRSRLAALRARRLEHQRGELLEDVGLLQAALLPVPPARLGAVGTSVAYRPADGPAAGGDFYDVFELDDGRFAVIVGDVSGHGRQALPHTALVRFTLRAYLEAGLSPRLAVQTAGAVLERQLGGSFVTVVAATYRPSERILVYACAGHPPPIVLGSHGLAPITAAASPPIGAGMRTGTRQTVLSIPGGARICFHTDGLTEARIDSQLFGVERLERTLAELGSDDGAATLLERVAQATDARPDDMAACLLHVEGASAPPVALIEELELDRDDAAAERTASFLRAAGVQRHELAEIVRSAGAAAGRAGTVVLELHLAEGSPPEVVLQRENLAMLHPPRAGQRADIVVAS
jgi:Stage II sporulation protein E (SpoIIE)